MIANVADAFCLKFAVNLVPDWASDAAPLLKRQPSRFPLGKHCLLNLIGKAV